jgi:hypothetical protein
MPAVFRRWEKVGIKQRLEINLALLSPLPQLSLEEINQWTLNLLDCFEGLSSHYKPPFPSYRKKKKVAGTRIS